MGQPSPGVDEGIDELLEYVRGDRSGGGDTIYVGAILFVSTPL
jgi:hypothetical protein